MWDSYQIEVARGITGRRRGAAVAVSQRGRGCTARGISLLSRTVSKAQPEQLHDLEFRHPWRPYQRRVLDAARLHLADRRLHVVSAPGSGKTTLGLEMFRQL